MSWYCLDLFVSRKAEIFEFIWSHEVTNTNSRKVSFSYKGTSARCQCLEKMPPSLTSHIFPWSWPSSTLLSLGKSRSAETYCSIRHLKYSFAMRRHSVSFVPLMRRTQRRYSPTIGLHSPAIMVMDQHDASSTEQHYCSPGRGRGVTKKSYRRRTIMVEWKRPSFWSIEG